MEKKSEIPKEIDDHLKLFGKDIPMGRVGEPKEIGQVASFLCSDKASFISGEYIIVDGRIMDKGGWDTELQGE